MPPKKVAKQSDPNASGTSLTATEKRRLAGKKAAATRARNKAAAQAAAAAAAAAPTTRASNNAAAAAAAPGAPMTRTKTKATAQAAAAAVVAATAAAPGAPDPSASGPEHRAYSRNNRICTTEGATWTANPNWDNAMLPYFAMGFDFQETSGAGLLCGANAIAISLRAAQALNDPKNKARSRQWTGNRIAALVDTEQYRRKCQKIRENLEAVARSENDWSAQRRQSIEEYMNETFRRHTLSRQQLQIFVDIINEDLGTDYVLGVLSQGYVLTDRDGKVIKRNPTSASAMDPTVEFGSRPIIWIYADSAEGMGRTLEVSAKKMPMGHYEGFSLGPGRSTHPLNISGVGLLQAAVNDANAGVWIVTDEFVNNGPNQIRVSRGAFVRDANVPDGLKVPDGWRFVDPSGRNTKPGLVPGNVLRKVQVAANGSVAYRNGRYIGGRVIGGPPQLPQPEELPFNILRTIGPTDKVGNPGPPLPNYPNVPCRFMHDNVLNRDDGFRNVHDITGTQRFYHPRQLQKLLLPPWGIQTLPYGSENDWNDQRYDTWTDNELQLLAGRYGIKESKNLRRRILRYEEENNINIDLSVLPMRKLSRSYTANEAGGEAPFCKDEIVLVVTALPADPVVVRDYEGKYGRLASGDLEVVDEQPWGLSAHTTPLQHKLNQMLAQNRPKPSGKQKNAAGNSGAGGNQNDNKRKAATPPASRPPKRPRSI
ncbi:hypothetical protein BP5796_09533 [Coleophoma crateriformis]|uniref:Uncharacterized protein n=1 Tax=Coleophoma crateriformis TaxID=565419 RepID=A0A3D8QZ01_9HELO|nr:hypothetical protein BP5796_09533 [Coleophoma crateriformis]